MANRPETARSEISTAVSDEGANQSQSIAVPRFTATPDTSSTQATHSHLRTVLNPQNRTLRSPPPTSTTPTTLTTSRPNSPETHPSRTHIPSLTAQGFLRPAGSTRTQHQRNQSLRTNRALNAPLPIADGDSDSRSTQSNRTGPYASLPRSHRPAPSVTTGYSESDVAENVDATARRYGPDMSRALANPPAATTNSSRIPPPLNLRNSLRVGSIRDSGLHSPRSFRSGLSIGSKHIFEPGHQHLSSDGTSPRPLDMQEKRVAQKSALGKNHEYFEGNTMFWLGGRLQNTRDRPINIATGTVLIVPIVLFFVFVAPWVWHHVSPAIPIVVAYLSFICVSSFLHASLTDPGIFPRNIHPLPAEDTDNPLAIGHPTNDWVMVRMATSDTAAMDVPVKYCDTCKIWRPPRCYHCRVCDNCVDTLDHHCVWLNNCVGRRNYRYFFTFIASGTFLGLMLSLSSLGQVIAYSNQEHVSFTTSINRNRVPFALFFVGFLAGAYPIALWVYHLMLTGRGETTREYLASRRFAKDERHRPFTFGNVFKNWIAVLGRPKPPTYMHFKKRYEQGDQRFGERRAGERQAKLKEDAQGGGLEMTPVQKGHKPFEGPQGRPSQKETR